ncbi:MAG: DUF1015 domain-containing protein [Planctomycetota bacterium]
MSPVKALRPPPDLAGELACPPYDTVDRDLVRRGVAGRDWSFLRVTRPDCELPPGTTRRESALRGRDNLQHFVSKGYLVPDEGPAFYVIRQDEAGRSQTGLVCSVSCRDVLAGHVIGHEATLPEKVEDRKSLIVLQGACSEPLMMFAKAGPEFSLALSEHTNQPPLYDITEARGVRHRLWRAGSPSDLSKLATIGAGLGKLYIADGHHRCEAFARALDERPAAPGHVPGFLAAVFSHSELAIRDYNRMIRDLGPVAKEDFLKQLRHVAHVRPARQPRPERPGNFGMIFSGSWHEVEPREPAVYDRFNPVAFLDAQRLEDLILGPLLGIRDIRTDPRVEFCGGQESPVRMEELHREGWALGFTVHPPSLKELIAVADAGLLMPPKSTWFEPKMLSGLVVMPLDGF